MAPDCHINEPSEGDTIRIDSLVQVLIEAEDEDGVIDELKVFLDGEELKVFSQGPFRFVWNTTGLTEGNKVLKAAAWDDEGESKSHEVEVFLDGNEAPAAAFTVQPDSNNVGNPFSFDASSTTDAEDPLSALSFRWDWESDGTYDKNWSGDPLAQHSYSQPGQYTVTLEVRDSDGATATATHNLLVTGQAPLRPVAAFSVDPDSGTVQTTFTVDASPSYDPDGNPSDLTFRWDWNGDGSFDTPYQGNPIASQIYPDTGTYHLILQVRDADGLTNKDTATIFVFDVPATGQPCPGLPTFTYAGKTYNTVQIGSLCWFRDNLDIGSMVSPSQGQQNNTSFEKYCYNNDPVNCALYGGLYQWDEAMAYNTGGQGICPPGWRLPTDEDFKYAEGIADSQYDTLAGIWDSTGFRGIDAGYVLKSESGWSQGGDGSNGINFSALPGGGAYGASGGFTGNGIHAMFWTSDEEASSAFATARYLDSGEEGVYRGGFQKMNAFSIRCIRQQ